MLELGYQNDLVCKKRKYEKLNDDYWLDGKSRVQAAKKQRILEELRIADEQYNGKRLTLDYDNMEISD